MIADSENVAPISNSCSFDILNGLHVNPLFWFDWGFPAG